MPSFKSTCLVLASISNATPFEGCFLLYTKTGIIESDVRQHVNIIKIIGYSELVGIYSVMPSTTAPRVSVFKSCVHSSDRTQRPHYYWDLSDHPFEFSIIPKSRGLTELLYASLD